MLHYLRIPVNIPPMVQYPSDPNTHRGSLCVHRSLAAWSSEITHRNVIGGCASRATPPSPHKHNLTCTRANATLLTYLLTYSNVKQLLSRTRPFQRDILMVCYTVKHLPTNSSGFSKLICMLLLTLGAPGTSIDANATLNYSHIFV